MFAIMFRYTSDDDNLTVKGSNFEERIKRHLRGRDIVKAILRMILSGGSQGSIHNYLVKSNIQHFVPEIFHNLTI
jgi:hypothetical protein